MHVLLIQVYLRMLIAVSLLKHLGHDLIRHVCILCEELVAGLVSAWPIGS